MVGGCGELCPIFFGFLELFNFAKPLATTFTLTVPVHLFQDSGSPLVILEVGCGVGNFLFPLLEEDPTMFFYACDFSPRAVTFVRENPLYDEDRCHAFQCDITTHSLTEHVRRPVDLITMIFVLSAIHPDKMRQALENITQV